MWFTIRQCASNNLNRSNNLQSNLESLINLKCMCLDCRRESVHAEKTLEVSDNLCTVGDSTNHYSPCHRHALSNTLEFVHTVFDWDYMIRLIIHLYPARSHFNRFACSVQTTANKWSVLCCDTCYSSRITQTAYLIMVFSSPLIIILTVIVIIWTLIKQYHWLDQNRGT